MKASAGMKPLALAIAGLAMGVGMSTASAAEVGVEDFDGVVEEVVSLGTRRDGRAAVDTAVAVDVFGLEQIESVNSSDMVNVLSTLVPSFNVTRQPISDGATFIRPVELRGLDSHHALVLVNGKRRHRASLLQLGGFGAHGPDVGSIPTIALKSVEVLRDGAAAQYGSDAIAGVINFNLKDNSSGADVRVKYGEYEQGDGEEVTFEGNFGLPLGDAGFISFSGQYSDAEATNRSQPYDISIGSSGLIPSEARNSAFTDPVTGQQFFGPDAFTNTYAGDGTLIQSILGSDGIPDDLDTRYDDNFGTINGSGPFSNVAQVWGQPEQEQYLLFVNAALPLTDRMELYGFGNYSTKEVAGGFFHRRPGVSQLLPIRLEDGSIYNPRDSLYPSGFTPQFGGDVTDMSGVLGLRGDLDNELSYDLSVSYGENEIAYTLANTMNPALGPATPTSFRPGDLINEEFALNAGFSFPVDVGLASPLSIAFGAEYREETYEIVEGEPLSYDVGTWSSPDPFNFEITQAEVDADTTGTLTQIECRIPGFEAVGALCPAGDPINNALPLGSNGFPGYSPDAAGAADRDSYAFYVDLEADITNEWLVNGAARYEDYSDFGNVGIWKLATRYALTDNVNVRASVGTGFRAPTMGQVSTTNVSTRIAPDGSPIAEGIFPPDNPAAGVFGATTLDAEDSFSWTLGLAATPMEGLTVTLDYYYVELTDRIVLSSQFAVGPDEVAQLEALGVVGASNIAQVRFFTNDVDSETSGVDLVATYDFDWSAGSTSLAAAVNMNSTEITEAGSFINAETEYDVEHNSPELRANLSARHTWNQFDFMLRGRYYGEYQNAQNATLELTQTFDPTLYVDLEATWNFMENYRLTFGGVNVFDEFPDKDVLGESCCGRIYRSDSIPDWQGQFFYLQASVSF